MQEAVGRIGADERAQCHPAEGAAFLGGAVIVAADEMQNAGQREGTDEQADAGIDDGCAQTAAEVFEVEAEEVLAFGLGHTAAESERH